MDIATASSSWWARLLPPLHVQGEASVRKGLLWNACVNFGRSQGLAVDVLLRACAVVLHGNRRGVDLRA